MPNELVLDPASTTTTTEPPKAPAPSAPGAAWFNDSFKPLVELKGWKTPDDALTGYQNLEKLARTPVDRTLVIPEKADDREAWQQVRARLGAANPAFATPPNAEGYEFEGYEPVDGQPDLIQGDDGFRAKALELGLSKHDANELFKWYATKAQGFEEMSAEQRAEVHTAGMEKVKTQWGQAYDQNVGIAKQAVAALGLSSEDLVKIEDALGTEWLLNTFHRIGKQFGEHERPNDPSHVPAAAGRGGFGLTPAEAEHQVAELLRDPSFQKRYLEGDKDAVERMQRLHVAIAGNGVVRPNSVIAR